MRSASHLVPRGGASSAIFEDPFHQLTHSLGSRPAYNPWTRSFRRILTKSHAMCRKVIQYFLHVRVFSLVVHLITFRYNLVNTVQALKPSATRAKGPKIMYLTFSKPSGFRRQIKISARRTADGLRKNLNYVRINPNCKDQLDRFFYKDVVIFYCAPFLDFLFSGLGRRRKWPPWSVCRWRPDGKGRSSE